MSFHVGQKVVCVNDSNWFPQWRNCTDSLPARGRVYVVRDLLDTTVGPGLLLIGINGKRHQKFGHEIGFRADRFRALAELKQEAATRVRALESMEAGK